MDSIVGIVGKKHKPYKPSLAYTGVSARILKSFVDADTDVVDSISAILSRQIRIDATVDIVSIRGHKDL
jgi:hypothetical protein